MQIFTNTHIHTYSGQLQTCHTAGAYPLMNNPYLAIQVTLGGGDASSVTTFVQHVSVID